MGYKVKLKNFEGPFDLLVYLIENSEMSIYDIKISEITEQYMLYVDLMKRTNINDIGDFMVLAAELIEIKSKMLLPVHPKEGQQSMEEDPRSRLVEKLLEYKPKEDLSEYSKEPEENLIIDTDKFIQAFELFLHKKKKVEDVKKYYERVERQKVSMESKMFDIGEKFRSGKIKKLGFDELVDERNNYHIVLTFSAVLEMMRQRVLDAYQTESFSNIEVEYIGEGEAYNEQ